MSVAASDDNDISIVNGEGPSVAPRVLTKDSYAEILGLLQSSKATQRTKKVSKISSQVYKDVVANEEDSQHLPPSDLEWMVKNDVTTVFKLVKAKHVLGFVKSMVECGDVPFEVLHASRWNEARKKFVAKKLKKFRKKNPQIEEPGEDFYVDCDQAWNALDEAKRTRLLDESVSEKPSCEVPKVKSGYVIFANELFANATDGSTKPLLSEAGTLWSQLPAEKRLKYETISKASYLQLFRVASEAKDARKLLLVSKRVEDCPFFAYFSDKYDVFKEKHPDLDDVDLAKKAYKKFGKLSFEKVEQCSQKAQELAQNARTLSEEIREAARSNRGGVKGKRPNKTASLSVKKTGKKLRKNPLTQRAELLRIPEELASVCPQQSNLPNYYAHKRKADGADETIGHLKSEFSNLTDAEREAYRRDFDLERKTFTLACDEYLEKLPENSVEKGVLQERLRGLQQYKPILLSDSRLDNHTTEGEQEEKDGQISGSGPSSRKKMRKIDGYFTKIGPEMTKEAENSSS